MNTQRDVSPAAPRGLRRRSPHLNSWFLRALIGGLLLLVVFVGYSAFRSTQVALSMKLLEAEVRLLESRPELSADAPRMQALRNAAKKLESQTTTRVEALELLARVHWLYASTAPTTQAQIAELRLARDRLHQALARRSSWPYTWVLLARIEFNLAPRGEAARIALTEALNLGLRGYRLQVQLLELRLLSEGRVDPALQLRIRDSFLGGLREHGNQLAERAMRLGRVDWVCADAQARMLVTSWCARYTLTRGRPEAHQSGEDANGPDQTVDQH